MCDVFLNKKHYRKSRDNVKICAYTAEIPVYDSTPIRKKSTVETQDIKKAGLKVTLPRIRILQILETSGQRHMSAEDVYKALLEADEDVGLATIYRVLTQFEAAGLVVRHHFEEGHSVFELAQSEHHDHMICLDTGKIIEFHDEQIEQRQREIAESHGYELKEHNLVLYVKPR